MNLTPDYMLNDIYEITQQFLKEKNKTCVILDIDDTLVGHGVLEIPSKVFEWIKTMQEANIKLCLVSNNYKKRVENTLLKLNVPGVHFALKPSKKGYKKALEILNEKAENAVYVGDQIFTDIWGANRSNITSILVKPVGKKSTRWIKLKRKLEKAILENIQER